MIEEFIKKASITKEDNDYNSVFREIKENEVYFNVNKTPQGMTLPLTSVGEDLSAVIFYTSKEDRRLEESYGGMPWTKALEMLVKMDNANGLIIQGISEHWIAIKKKKIEELLSKY